MLLFLLFLLPAILAKTVVVNWDVTRITVNRDGHFTRPAIGVNYRLPIPPIYAHQHDTLILNVHNSLNESTSLHAHGLFQIGQNYMDGAAMATQCGIPPGHSFTYRYHLTQSGTFWVHGHDHHQNSNGLRTPLVIQDQQVPKEISYDEEYLFWMEDWYPISFGIRANETLDPSKPFPPPPTYPYGLINGYNGNWTKPIRFQKNKRYRIRLVNMSTTEWFKFHMPGHQMAVIETDGELTQPHNVDGLDMGPGQRYSVLVHAHSQDCHNYHYNVTLHASFVPNKPGLSPRYYQGLVEYKEGASQATDFVTKPAEDFIYPREPELRALDQSEGMWPVSRTIPLQFGGNKFSTGQFLDVVNNITYRQPLIPSLYSALSMADLATNPQIYGPQTHAIVLKYGEVVEFYMTNPNALPHPIHLHGHAFQVTEMGPVQQLVSPPPGISIPPPQVPNVIQAPANETPARRDTIVLPIMGYAKVRVRADNPGIWLMHCHMDIHFAMGMALTIVEAPLELQKQKVPQKMYEMCKVQGIKISGNGAGNQGLNLAGLPTPPTIVPRKRHFQ